MKADMHGVVAAIATPVDENGEPDVGRLAMHGEALFADGCDGLNLLGTTGEATSFSVAQRLRVMESVASGRLPAGRMMVGTGAASSADAVLLTLAAARLGFAAALVLPPFYYKPVKEDGIADYIGRIVSATADTGLPIYLYNFPALSGIEYTPALVRRLIDAFGSRIAGLKDSSGDLGYAGEIAGISSSLRVFPSNEGTLMDARDGRFAGCISATANLNASSCARAYRNGDRAALDQAVAVRALFDGLPLVPGIKHLLAETFDDRAWKRMASPLSPLGSDEADVLDRRRRTL